MVAANEIRDEETLRAWLEARPEETRQRDAVTMAHRAAMRVLPSYIVSVRQTEFSKEFSPDLPVLCAALTCGAAARFYDDDALLDAAEAARDGFDEFAYGLVPAASDSFSAIFRAIRTVTNRFETPEVISFAARSAAQSMPEDADAFAAAHSIWRNTTADTVVLQREMDLLTLPLWKTRSIVSKVPQYGDPKHNPDAAFQIFDLWPDAKRHLSECVGFDFWIRWYEAAIEGRPLTGDWESHWALLRDIALIPDEDWSKGAVHIAERIAEIELGYLARLPLGEDEVEKGSDGVWHKASAPPVDRDILTDSVQRVLDRLDEIDEEVEAGRGNMFSALSRDTRQLRKTIARYGDRPLRLHDCFLLVQSHIVRNLNSGELPDDDLVHDLSADLGTAAIDLRNADPKARAVIEARMQSRIAQLDDTDKALIEVLGQAAVEISDDELGEEFIEDAELVTDEQANPAERIAAGWRLSGRFARMGKDVIEAVRFVGSVTSGMRALYDLVTVILKLLL